MDKQHQWINIDILAGKTASKTFLHKNPNGKIPLMTLDDDRHLSESNAIVNYLASGSDLLPTNTFALAKVQMWQFFEQYSHEPYIAVARFIAKYLGLPEQRHAEYKAKQTGGHKALSVMEKQLTQHDFLVDNKLSTADISLYAYTHVADEGGFNLQQYPAIQQWLVRIENLPKYTPMQNPL